MPGGSQAARRDGGGQRPVATAISRSCRCSPRIGITAFAATRPGGTRPAGRRAGGDQVGCASLPPAADPAAREHRAAAGDRPSRPPTSTPPQREEAAVAAALARVGRELIAQLDQPVLLDRLCRLTIEVLGCDGEPHLPARPRARRLRRRSPAYGDPAEQWAAVQVVRVPARRPSSRFVPGDGRRRRRRCRSLDLRASGAGDAPLAAVGDAARRVLAMALRRGDELVGVHVARCHVRDAPVQRPAQERIADGVAQLASLALDNARLIAELDRADRVKSDFVASMSHELRTPLNVIIGYSDLLARPDVRRAAPASSSDTVRRIAEQGRELLELVNTTLDMSRLESERVPVALQEVDLGRRCSPRSSSRRSWCAAMPPSAIAWDVGRATCRRCAPIRSKLQGHHQEPAAQRDQVHRRGAASRCASRRARRRRRDRVCDTGIGIAAELLPQIFDAFRQGDHGGEPPRRRRPRPAHRPPPARHARRQRSRSRARSASDRRSASGSRAATRPARSTRRAPRPGGDRRAGMVSTPAGGRCHAEANHPGPGGAARGRGPAARPRSRLGAHRRAARGRAVAEPGRGAGGAGGGRRPAGAAVDDQHRQPGDAARLRARSDARPAPGGAVRHEPPVVRARVGRRPPAAGRHGDDPGSGRGLRPAVGVAGRGVSDAADHRRRRCARRRDQSGRRGGLHPPAHRSRRRHRRAVRARRARRAGADDRRAGEAHQLHDATGHGPARRGGLRAPQRARERPAVRGAQVPRRLRHRRRRPHAGQPDRARGGADRRRAARATLSPATSSTTSTASPTTCRSRSSTAPSWCPNRRRA